MRRVRHWFLAAFTVAGLTGIAQGQTRGGGPGFWLVGLPAGASASGVKALSQDGLVAGGGSFIPATNQSGSFRWSVAKGRDDWGFVAGMPDRNSVDACDSTGQIVAGVMWWNATPVPHPFRRVGEGPLIDLGVLAGQTRSYAHGISGDGSIVVGHAENGPNSYEYGRAWKWTPSGGMQNLGGLTAQSFLSDAKAISRDGTTIVGLNINEVLWFQAFTWRQGEGMKALPTLTGAVSGSNAWGVNADGTVVVGSSSSASGWVHAVRWTPKGVDDIAGDVFVNKHSTAFAACDDGSVITGAYYVSGSDVAFVWSEAQGMLDAKEYMDLHGVSVPIGYKLANIYAISGDGRTFGGLALRPDGKFEGWVATVSATASCVPDCDGSAKLDIDDFICFQTYFAIGDAKADCDASGTLDIDDFICFQTFFALGC
jgi:probable HAF family extracellular repeat protein